MANKINHRRNGQRKRREGETLKNWASNGGIQGASRGRRRWKRIRERTVRRTGRYFGYCAVFRPVELEQVEE